MGIVMMCFKLFFGLFDMMFWVCTLGKLDPKTRRFF
ncbi:hypothetical protein SEA_ALONE_116 [Streptomyces phage Alone3]|nr:hypothetical protein SEA_ALONE_116 [Streptomyces phage Alone3]